MNDGYVPADSGPVLLDERGLLPGTFLRSWLSRLTMVAALLGGAASLLRAQGFDANGGAVTSAAIAADLRQIGNIPGGWLRIRGLPDPLVSSPEIIALKRETLGRLRANGFHSCVVLRPPAAAWTGKVRNIPLAHLPLDLREAHAWIRRLQETYGDVVDRWEIDNEPDIQFVTENAENYAAYLKACWWAAKTTQPRQKTVDDSSADLKSTAGVLMGGLALPPGPYLENLLANDFLAYTDGFNYHYYGYAEDFSDVYRRFRDALVSPAQEAKHAVTAPQTRRRLPVFLSEYGFGLLSAEARDTVEGRLRQWRWFRDVTEQHRRLRVEGGMAFLLVPYLEYQAKEFGLTVAPPGKVRQIEPSSAMDGDDDRLPTWEKILPDTPASVRALEAIDPRRLGVGSLEFAPEMFGAREVEPWMNLIGRPVGGYLMTPALAWMLGTGKTARPAKDWEVAAPKACPVVIDFVAISALQQTKQGQGYFVANGAPATGEVRVYNFGSDTANGSLDLGEAIVANAPESVKLSLQPGEVRVFPVTLEPQFVRGGMEEWRISFRLDASSLTSRFRTRLHRTPGAGERKVVSDLGSLRAGTANATRLARRQLATGEPTEKQAGRWSCTRGVHVTEDAEGWTFTIASLPAEPSRPAMAEVILPDDFQLRGGSFLTLEYRLAPRPATGENAPVLTDAAKSATLRNAVGIAWRTANGNVYTVWRPPPATSAWRPYAQALRSFSLGFYSRAKAPWRLEENRPMTLLFTFLPAQLPATFQVRRAQLVTYTGNGGAGGP